MKKIRKEIKLDSNLLNNIKEYINYNYFEKLECLKLEETIIKPKVERKPGNVLNKHSNGLNICRDITPKFDKSKIVLNNSIEINQNKSNIKDYLSVIDETFQVSMFRIIDKKGYIDTDVYERSHLDRRLFNKIRCNENFKPSKKTAVSICIGLKLNLDETLDLLKKAGYTLSSSSISDLIIKYLIENGEYDIDVYNEVLYQYNEPLLYL